MTDHTPSGSQPQTAEFEDWAVSQMYAVRTDSGRLKWNSPAYEAIAKAALSAPAVETVAVQEAPDIIAACMKCATPELCAIRMECADRAYQSRVAPPLPVAPKAEPDRYINVQNAWALLKAERTEEALAVLSKLIGADFMPTPQSAQPVGADTLTDEQCDDIIGAVRSVFGGMTNCCDSTKWASMNQSARNLIRAAASPARAAEQAAPTEPGRNPSPKGMSDE